MAGVSFKESMDIKQHHNLVQILQFLGVSAFMLMFFLSVDVLKEYGAFNPAIFILGPIVPALVIRAVMILYFSPVCPQQSCNGKMILNFFRNRRYSCNSCAYKYRLKQLKYDNEYKKRVYKLLSIAGAIIFLLVSIAIFNIIKNAS